MKPRNLLILLVFTVLMVALASYRTARDRETAFRDPRVGDAVFPELDINRIARISVTGNGSTTTIHRVGGRWTIAEKYDYPADYQRLHSLLMRIDDMNIGRRVVLDETVRHDLRLLSPDLADPGIPTGTRILMLDANADKLASLIVGKEFYGERPSQQEPFAFQRRRADGRYIKTHTGSAYLVTETFDDLVTEPEDWIDRAFLDLPVRNLSQLTWTSERGESFQLVRESPDEAWQAEPLPREEAVLDGDRVSDLMSTLRDLRFEDIADPSLSSDEIGMSDNDIVSLSADSDDGRRYKLQVGKPIAQNGRERHAFRVTSDYELPPEDAGPEEEAAGDRAAAMHRHMESIRRLNERFDGWTFWISAERAHIIRVPEIEQWFLAKEPGDEETAPEAGE